MALAALREDQTIADLCKEVELHVTLINDWKRQPPNHPANVFGDGTASELVHPAPLHAKVGQLGLENDLLEGAAGLLCTKR